MSFACSAFCCTNFQLHENININFKYYITHIIVTFAIPFREVRGNFVVFENESLKKGQKFVSNPHFCHQFNDNHHNIIDELPYLRVNLVQGIQMSDTGEKTNT